MEPVIANSSSKKCGSAISSNCVTYVPPDSGLTIPCVPICNTDTVSDILVKLGQTECYTQSLLDLSGLDLSCCYTPCPSCQQPTKLVDVLQIMQNCICSLTTRVTTLEATVADLVQGVNPTP